MGRRILLVDDDLVIRRLIRSVLEEEGYIVDVAEDSSQALWLIEEHEPDLVLLDLLLPGMDGQETMNFWRRHPRAAGVPVVVISSAPRACQRAKAMGAKAFLAKPFELEDLLRVVRENLPVPEIAASDTPCQDEQPRWEVQPT